jgi:hypothetical protein
LQALLRKLERRHGQQITEDVNKSMKLIRSASKGYFLVVEEIIEQKQPPMLDVPQYQAWRKQIGRRQ